MIKTAFVKTKKYTLCNKTETAASLLKEATAGMKTVQTATVITTARAIHPDTTGTMIPMRIMEATALLAAAATTVLTINKVMLQHRAEEVLVVAETIPATIAAAITRARAMAIPAVIMNPVLTGGARAAATTVAVLMAVQTVAATVPAMEETKVEIVSAAAINGAREMMITVITSVAATGAVIMV